MPEDIPVSERVKRSFSNLAAVSTVLNNASDRLSQNITALEGQLKNLSVGISSWVKFDDRVRVQSNYYDFDRLGYTKVNGKWGLVIETLTGEEAGYDSDGTQETWPFNEAPRAKRVKAVKSIPDLLDKLAKDAAKMVDEVDQQAAIVEEITKAITAPAQETSPFKEKLKAALQPIQIDEDDLVLLDETPSEVKRVELVAPAKRVPTGGKK
ncbi:MAG: hypothetical protein WDO73_24575 [Ignavibacteriota bacterium]